MPLLKNILKKIGKYGLYTILFLCSLVIIGIVSGISFSRNVLIVASAKKPAKIEYFNCLNNIRNKIFGWKL